MNFGHDIPDETVRKRQDVVYGQGKRIVETQRPELLPLDLSAELHVRSDRLAVEYRKWLKELGVDTGAAPGPEARLLSAEGQPRRVSETRRGESRRPA